MFITIIATGYGPELLTLSKFEKRRVHSVACKNQATISTQTARQILKEIANMEMREGEMRPT